ncbi:MAG: hypothetical protein Q8N63_02305 [Nanoarchaeota archaeon]|nr:hypothetical protein [Nanoarchaeota archaeon]
MKTWLKWGLIGGIIGIVFHIILIFIMRTGGEFGPVLLILDIIPLTILGIIIGSYDSLTSLVVGIYVFATFFWFIIGALIGLIIGKIKSRRKKK